METTNTTEATAVEPEVSSRSPEEVAVLFNHWKADPCFDLEDADGFEAHRDELIALRAEQERKWSADRVERGPENPPAFPVQASDLPGSCYAAPGMDLRDYFAAKAMQSIFTGPGARMVADRDHRYDQTNWAFIVASNAYDMADAMLAARAKATGKEAV